jgi:hypothetical protein
LVFGFIKSYINIKFRKRKSKQQAFGLSDIKERRKKKEERREKHPKPRSNHLTRKKYEISWANSPESRDRAIDGLECAVVGCHVALDESTNHNFSQQQASPKYRPPPLSTLEMSQQSFVSLELAAQCPELVNYSSLLDVHRISLVVVGCCGVFHYSLLQPLLVLPRRRRRLREDLRLLQAGAGAGVCPRPELQADAH